MINNKTVIVLGAGASQEAGLPLGEGLKSDIATLLDFKFTDTHAKLSGDNCILEALQLHVGHKPINNFLDACDHIRDAMPQVRSIDDFVNMHKGNSAITLCSKLAIARSILNSERRSRMYFDATRDIRPDFKPLQSTWYSSFIKLITEDCQVDDLASRLNSIVFIVFNYDRCMEYFLYHSFQNIFRISSEDAAELVRGIKIYHPYGMVGQLPWQRGVESMGFGASPNSRQLLNLVSQIKTYTEGIDPRSSEISIIRKKISEAGILVFLGFAFHKLNMELISPRGEVHSTADCYATALNESESNRLIIDGSVRRFCKKGFGRLCVDNVTCSKLFEQYWRNLALY